jgi:hypothetical protein
MAINVPEQAQDQLGLKVPSQNRAIESGQRILLDSRALWGLRRKSRPPVVFKIHRYSFRNTAVAS